MLQERCYTLALNRITVLVSFPARKLLNVSNDTFILVESASSPIQRLVDCLCVPLELAWIFRIQGAEQKLDADLR